MYESTISQTLRPMLEPALQAMGYTLVRILWRDSGRRTLQVMAERIDGNYMTVDDCADISHTISAILDVEDPISDAYDLEVSSPGMARPLTKRLDFDQYQGFEAKIEMQIPVNGRKRFKGKLLASPIPADIELETSEGKVVLPYAHMHSANLVVTEDQMRADLKARKKAAEA